MEGGRTLSQTAIQAHERLRIQCATRTRRHTQSTHKAHTKHTQSTHKAHTTPHTHKHTQTHKQAGITRTHANLHT